MHVLIAEDEEDHAVLTALGLRAAQPELSKPLDIDTVVDGKQALAYLRAEGIYAQRLWPDLLLLDLKMPDMGGLEVLSTMRSDPMLRAIPVIVLTTSARDVDVLEAYRLGANEYVTKPIRADELRSKLQAIPIYWSQVVRRPPDPSTLNKPRRRVLVSQVRRPEIPGHDRSKR